MSAATKAEGDAIAPVGTAPTTTSSTDARTKATVATAVITTSTTTTTAFTIARIQWSKSQLCTAFGSW